MAVTYADLRIRARDEFSAVLDKGEKALDQFYKTATRKDLLTASVATREALKSQVKVIDDLKAEYERLRTTSTGNMQHVGADMVNVRKKIYEAKDEFQRLGGALRETGSKLGRGGFSSFSKAADEIKASAEASANSLEGLRARVEALRAEQAQAASQAKTYLENQRLANNVGGNFGAANLAIGKNFAGQAASLKREISDLDARIHAMGSNAKGSFLQFSRSATAITDAANASRRASGALGELSQAQKVLESAERSTRTTEERLAAQTEKLRAARAKLSATYGEESAEVHRLDAAMGRLEDKQRRLASRGAGGADASGRRKAKQNWGSEFVGQDQEVMAFGLRPYQLTNLGYQVNDVVSGIMMGQPIMQIFAQQVGQLLQIFPAFSRGMMGIFQILEKSPKLWGAAAAGVGIFLAAFNRVRKEAQDGHDALKGANESLALLAERSNYSAKGFADAALKMREVAGSIQEAVALAKTFASYGIKETRFNELAQTAQDFARLTGTKLQDAGATLAEAFSGGFESIRKLDKELNIFSASELEAIRSMYAAGDAAGAQEYALDALQSKMASVSDEAGGPWSKAASALGGAWDALLNTLANSVIVQGTVSVFNALGEAVGGVADAATRVMDSDLFKIAAGDLSPIFGEQEQTIESLTAKLDELDAALKRAKEQSDRMPGFFNWITGGDQAVAQLQQLRDDASAQIEAMRKAKEASGAGLTTAQLEATRKNLGDFRADLAKTNKERAQETSMIGLSKAEIEQETAVREALNRALELGLDKLPEWADEWKKEEAAIRASIKAKQDAEAAQKKLTDAEELVKGLISDTSTEREKSNEEIAKAEAAIETLSEKYGDHAEIVIKAREALARFKDEQANATTAFDELGKMIPDVAKELDRMNKLAEINKLEKEALAAAKSWEDVVDVLVRARQAREAVDLATKDASYYEQKYSVSRFAGTGVAGAAGGPNLSGLSINASQARELVSSTAMVAKELGISTKDLLTAMSYETGGTLDPWKKGPTTKYGEHRGLIQWGQPQRDQYGVSQQSSITEQIMAVGRYLQDTGVKSGDGLLQIYAAINAGNARNYSASDAANGGAPGSVSDKVDSANMKNNAAKAEGLLAAYQGVADASEEAAKNQEKLADQQEKFRAGLKDSIADQEFENSLQGKSKTDREIALAIRRAENAAKKVGLTLQDEERQKIAQLIRDKNAMKDVQEQANKAEERVNQLLSMRASLEKQLQIAKDNGDSSQVSVLNEKIASLNQQLLEAIAKAEAMWGAVGGEKADVAITKLQTAALEAKNFGQTSRVTGQQINDMLVSGAGSALSQLAQDLAAGKDAVRSLGDAFRTFVSNALIQIGQLIIKLTIMNALKNSGMGDWIAGGINGLVHHTGGIIGSGAPSRTVSPAVFAGATRYHTGGIIGLKPNERPVIAEVGEEMLTSSDPRHSRNGGRSPQAQPVTVINAVDGSDALDQALATSRGKKVIMNFMQSNRDQIKGVLE